jgi:hypothetical protein
VGCGRPTLRIVSLLRVAAQFVWDEYPALRVGRMAAGQPDVGRSPRGETHLVDGPDAAATLCGLPRARFPHDFAEAARLDVALPCATCQGAAASRSPSPSS